MLAHHYVTGIELAKAAGQDDLAAELRRPALDALRVAGQRALSLDIASAGTYISRALELAGPADALRPRLLFLQAEVLSSRSQLREAIVCLEEAIPAARASGDVRLAATAMALLGRVHDDVGAGGGDRLLDDAVKMLEAEDGPSRELLQLLAELITGAVWGDQPAGPEEGLRLSERAAAVSRELGIPLPPEVLGSHASLLADIGAPGWEEEFARAIEAASRLGLARSLWAMLHNRGESVLAQRGPADAWAAVGELREFVERVGAEVWQTDYRGMSALVGALLGRWDDALADARANRVWAAGQDEALYYIQDGSLEVVLLSFLGQMRGLGELADEVDAAARDSGFQYVQLYGRLSCVVARGALGRSEIALSAVREWCARQVRVYGDGRNAVIFPEVMRVCAAASGALSSATRQRPCPRSACASS